MPTQAAMRGLGSLHDIADSLGSSINRIDLDGVPAERMLELCDDRAFLHQSRQVRDKERIASDIRGVFPELLSVALLSQAGYHLVRPSVEVQFDDVGRRQIDCAGVQLPGDGGDCRIVEVKGGAASRHDLDRAVRRFAQTVVLAGEQRTRIADALGWSQRIVTVSGLFIAMADIGVPEDLKGLGIEIWTLSRFKEELLEADIPASYVSLLDVSLEVWEEDKWDF